MTNYENEKALAASRAVEEIRDGMLVGLGTGSTANYALRGIAQRLRSGLRMTATATSEATAALAKSLNIPLVPFNGISRVDLTIDGADEIDPQFRAIKGSGGALLREKVVAAASDREIIVVDSTKLVAVLGGFKLPVEVLPFAAAFAERSLREFDAPVVRRVQADGSAYTTDQGAYIYDIAFGVIADPESLARRIERIPGVIEHGLFLDQIDTVIVATGETVQVSNR